MQNALSSAHGVTQSPSSGSSGSSGQWENDVKSVTSKGEFGNEPLQDPLIYPGLYAPSGFDMMGILVGVVQSSALVSLIPSGFIFCRLLSIVKTPLAVPSLFLLLSAC